MARVLFLMQVFLPLMDMWRLETQARLISFSNNDNL